MVHTIAELRTMAQLNMSPECFKIYLAMVEPGIEAMAKEYFKGWQNFEAFLSLSVMRHMGAFKTRIGVIQIDEDELEKYGDHIDVAKYQKVREMSVFRMIEYLENQQLIGPNTCEFFHFVRKRRNSIHTFDGTWSEDDRGYFELAWSLVHYLYLELSGSGLHPSLEGMKTALEATASALLNGAKNTEGQKATFMFDSAVLRSKAKTGL
jgi:hypothetical protein